MSLGSSGQKSVRSSLEIMKTPVLLMPSSLSSCLDVQLVPFNWILPISILICLGLRQIKTKQKCPVQSPSNALLLIAKFVGRAVYTHWLHSLTSHLALSLAFAPSVFKNAQPVTQSTNHFSFLKGICLLIGSLTHPSLSLATLPTPLQFPGSTKRVQLSTPFYYVHTLAHTQFMRICFVCLVSFLFESKCSHYFAISFFLVILYPRQLQVGKSISNSTFQIVYFSL